MIISTPPQQPATVADLVTDTVLEFADLAELVQLHEDGDYMWGFAGDNDEGPEIIIDTKSLTVDVTDCEHDGCWESEGIGCTVNGIDIKFRLVDDRIEDDKRYIEYEPTLHY